MTFEDPDMRERTSMQYKPDEGPTQRHVSVIVLEILQGTATQRMHRLLQSGAGTVTLGRSPASTVVITDFHLSGDHAQITQVGEHFVFRDLRSTNGSAVER